MMKNHKEIKTDILNQKKIWHFPHPYYYKKIGSIGVWFIDTQILDVMNKDFEFTEEVTALSQELYGKGDYRKRQHL